MTNEEIYKIFLDTNAVLKGHFQLTSGRHSDTYMQCALLFTSPKKSEILCKDLASRLEEYKADYVVSPAVGGILMGYEVARALDVPNIFAERVDGVMTFRRGFVLPKGSKVIVVEDVVTTGGSVKEVMSLVSASGSEVVAVGSIVDRSNGNVDFGAPYKALLTMEVVSYLPEECPICKTGSIAVKPGSRGLK